MRLDAGTWQAGIVRKQSRKSRLDSKARHLEIGDPQVSPSDLGIEPPSSSFPRAPLGPIPQGDFGGDFSRLPDLQVVPDEFFQLHLQARLLLTQPPRDARCPQIPLFVLSLLSFFLISSSRPRLGMEPWRLSQRTMSSRSSQRKNQKSPRCAIRSGSVAARPQWQPS